MRILMDILYKNAKSILRFALLRRGISHDLLVSEDQIDDRWNLFRKSDLINC